MTTLTRRIASLMRLKAALAELRALIHPNGEAGSEPVKAATPHDHQAA